MKKTYVVEVRWYEDGKWMNTNLHAFSNRKAAQSYVDYKEAHKSNRAIADNSEYRIEELALFSKNPFEE